jgi:hypothetical protein
MRKANKMAGIFFKSNKYSVKFFHKTASQGLLCCSLPLTRPLPQPPQHAPVNAKKAARFLLPPKLFPAIIVPGNLYVCFAYMLKRQYHPYFNNTSAALSASFTAAFCIAFLPEIISAVSAAPAYALSAQTMLLFAVDIILSSTRALEVR